MFYFNSIPIAAKYFSKSVDIATNAPTATDFTITFFIPPILFVSSLSILYFSVFPTFLFFTRTSPGMVTSTILTSFLVLSIIAMSGRQALILVLHWIVKSRKIFFLNNSIWLILVPLRCSFKAMFFTMSQMKILAYIAMPLFLFLLGQRQTFTHNM